VSEKLGKRHKTVEMRAHQMGSLLRRWLPNVPLKLMGDTASSLLELGLHCVAQRVTLLAPFRLDSGIHQPPEVRSKHTIGRRRVVGKRLPSLETVLHDRKTMWQRITVDWYGEGKRVVEICTATALWDRSGSDPLPIRWVLTRDPEGKRPPKALFSTDQSQTAEEIVLDFMKRWSLETTFEESHAHLGIQTQRQWSDLATRRTTPLLFGLYSLVTIFGHALPRDTQRDESKQTIRGATTFSRRRKMAKCRGNKRSRDICGY
jgi:hypothetical protein